MDRRTVWPFSGHWFSCAALRQPHIQLTITKERSQVPSLPPQWHASETTSALAEASRLIMARHCPKDMPAPQQEWVTSASQGLLRQHALLRKLWFGAISSRRRVLAPMWFLGVGSCSARGGHG